MKYCTVKGCENKHCGRGYCTKHYKRFLRKQDINANTMYDKRPAIIDGNIAIIPLGVEARDGYAIVDKKFADLDRYNWHTDKYGYACKTGIGLLHHQIIGRPEVGYEIDHINNDRLDNRRSNLRIVTRHQNNMNSSIQSNSRNKFKGIFKNYNKWGAKICYNHRQIYLGGYDSPEQAALAYNKAAIKYFGEYACLNDVS